MKFSNFMIWIETADFQNFQNFQNLQEFLELIAPPDHHPKLQIEPFEREEWKLLTRETESESSKAEHD